MDRDNLWTRRSKQSTDLSKDNSGRPLPRSRLSSSDIGSNRPSLANGITPLNTKTAAPPGKSSAFGLGSGAFASFGSATKTPKTPGTAFDFSKTSSSSVTTTTTTTVHENERPSKFLSKPTLPDDSRIQIEKSGEIKGHMPLKTSWIIWYRPPAAKNSDYEKSIKPVYKISTAHDFWRVFSHLKRPSSLPAVSDYHFFRDGVRPVWEDEENKRGGKWIMRLKKGVIDRYWEDLLLATIGDQFFEAGEEVCGLVVSVRSGEDVLSIWTKRDGGRNVKIRETVKRVLNLPSDTHIVWKSHDDSIAQRSAIDQARQEKGNAEKRRNTLNDGGNLTREKSNAS